MLRSKKVIDPIPNEFETLAEAGEFWDTHDTTDYPEAFTDIGFVKSKFRWRTFMEMINIPEIELEWIDWVKWTELLAGELATVPSEAGVYEVAYTDEAKPFSGERLTIGQAGHLKKRIRQLIREGAENHSTGKQIRANEDKTQLMVRWATTDSPCAVEEELHKNIGRNLVNPPNIAIYVLI